MPGGRDSAAEDVPYFFLSYAHSHAPKPAEVIRRNGLVKRFHDDLKVAVQELASPGPNPVATAVDFEIPIGNRWSWYISDNLARCRSFVALYSADYFSSVHCGQEWRAFANRQVTDHVLRDQRPDAVIPVLWQPVPDETMPDCAGELQYSHPLLGTAFRRHGMAYLMRHMSEHRSDYEQAVRYFAQRVVEVAEYDSPAKAEHYPNYMTLESAFLSDGKPTRSRRRIRFVIAAPTEPRLPDGADPAMYGHLSTMWRPYLPHFDGKIADAAGRLADSMSFTAFVEPFDASDEFSVGVPASAPTVLIIDPWAIRDAELRQRLARFDITSHTKLWIRPVVAWNRGHDANKAHATLLCSDLADALDQCRRRYRPDSPQVLDGLESIHQFITELPDVIRIAEQRYLSEIAPDPPPSAPARPRFGGPGPGFGGGRAPGEPDRIPPGPTEPSEPTGRPPGRHYLELHRRQQNPNPEGP